MVINNPCPECRPPRAQSVTKSAKPATHPARARAASSGCASSSGRGRSLLYGGTRGIQIEDAAPALPFTVIPSEPGEALMEVSSSPFDTSSGSGSRGADTPPDGTVMRRTAYDGTPPNARNMAAPGRPMHLHKWETFVQQNQLQINIDPDMIERYVESRISAERAEIGAAAAISQNQVQTEAEAVVGCNRVQAEAALHVAAAKTEAEVTKVRDEA